MRNEDDGEEEVQDVVVVVTTTFIGEEWQRPIPHDSAGLPVAKTVINAIFLEAVCHSRGN